VVLSDRTIREEVDKGRLVIEPLHPDAIQPASVDVRLDRKLIAFRSQQEPFYIDVKRDMDGLKEVIELDEDVPFFVQPGEFVLASTLEDITLPDDIVARLEGKSSLARIGLLMHSTAGYVDPGWQGHLTMQLTNVARLPVSLYRGMKIGQISFHRLSTPAERLYGDDGLGSKYQGQVDPTASRFHLNFEV
jgi:dCTP deaminase